MSSRFFASTDGGLRSLVLSGLSCVVLANIALTNRAAAEPRAIAPRGPLTPEEKSNIAVFESAKASVVYISTSERVMDYWTLNVQTVPYGTGSGFIWDTEGHVVTNLHVVAGAAEATVRLSDGKDYPATLIGLSKAHDMAVLQIQIPAKS